MLRYLSLIASLLFTIPTIAQPTTPGNTHDLGDHAPRFELGTKWTYEEVNGFGSGIPITRRPTTYEIIGQTTWQDTLVYVIEPGVYRAVEYMYIQGDSIYFWDWQAEVFQLNYDFSAGVRAAYDSNWVGLCDASDTGAARAVVDSITNLQIADDTILIQHLRVENNGSFTEDQLLQVYRGIGSQQGLTLGLGDGLCDFSWRIDRLRCFEDGENSYNFVGYPCDSTFLVSTTEEVASAHEILLYPNPSSGTVFVTQTGPPGDLPYQLYDLSGRLVQRGVLQNGRLEIARAGMYLLLLEQEGRRIPYRLTIVK